MTRSICGVDVSKARLDAHLLASGQSASFTNDAAGIAKLAAWAKAAAVELVAMEASGGCERLAFLLLWEADLPCALANPKQVRRFAQAMGRPEKNDVLDARQIARFAEVKALIPIAPPSAKQRRMTAAARRLVQIVDDMSIQKQRLSTTDDPVARRMLAEVITLLTRQRGETLAEIAAFIQDNPLWRALDRALRAVKGVAEGTVARLLAFLPEIGTLSAKAIAKIAGLAPIVNESGQRAGTRRIAGGRADVRSILYLVADIVRRYDPRLAEFSQRLRDKGKPKMVVRIAIAHKLLTWLNAKARDAREEFALAA